LAAHVFVAVVNGFQFANFLATPARTHEAFGVSAEQVNILVLATALTWVPAVPACIMLQHRKGAWRSLEVAAMANLAAAACKLIALLWVPGMALLTAAHIFHGASQVFFMTLPPIIASTWFPIPKRSMCTAIATLAEPVGEGFGYLLMPLLADVAATTATKSFTYVCAPQLVLAAVALMLLFIVPLKPLQPPSVTASEPVPMAFLIPEIKELLRNRNYILFALSSGLLLAAGTAAPAFAAAILTPFGVSKDHAWIIATLCCFFGAGAQILSGFVIDQLREYKPAIGAGSIVALLCAFVLGIALAAGASATVCAFILIPMMAAGFMFTQPAMYEFVVELTFPAPLPAAIGIHMFIARFAAYTAVHFAASMMLTASPTPRHALWIIFFLTLCFAAALAVLAMVPADYRRLRAERQHARGDVMERSLEMWMAEKTLGLSSTDADAEGILRDSRDQFHSPVLARRAIMVPPLLVSPLTKQRILSPTNL
jgi:FLVCR family MFS transporter 7